MKECIYRQREGRGLSQQGTVLESLASGRECLRTPLGCFVLLVVLEFELRTNLDCDPFTCASHTVGMTDMHY
jgi:hypothetical protein